MYVSTTRKCFRHVNSQRLKELSRLDVQVKAKRTGKRKEENNKKKESSGKNMVNLWVRRLR